MNRDVLARALWLITPVLLAGLGHVAILKAHLLSRLAIPIDAGAHWRDRPMFGANKTWRGPIVMTLGTALAALIQGALWRRPLPFRAGNDGIAGAVVGLTYALAELPNSFIKRRLGLPPGGRSRRFGRVQYCIDQIDSVAGCLIAARLLYRPSAADIAAAFALGTAAHIGVDRFMHEIGLKRAS